MSGNKKALFGQPVPPVIPPGKWDNNDGTAAFVPQMAVESIAFGTNQGTSRNLYYQQAGTSGVMPKETAGYASEAPVVGIENSYFNATVVTDTLIVQRPVGYGTEAVAFKGAINIDTANEISSYYVSSNEDLPPVPPSSPFVTSITSTTIEASFYDILNPSTAGFDYYIAYGTGLPDNEESATQINPALRIYSASITGLTANTNYYLQAIVYTADGDVNAVSAVVGPFTTTASGNNKPTPAPSIPALVGSSNNSLTVTTSAQGISSDTPPIITLLYGTKTDPDIEFTPVFVPGLQLYEATIPALEPGTQYYFKSVATNTHGATESVVSNPYTTASSGIGPNQAPTVPVVSGTPTTTSITVTFDVTGITGNPNPSFSVLYGPNNNANIPGQASLLSGSTYQAVISGLTPGTAYVFQSVASNSGGTKTSGISAPISTASSGTAPNQPPSIPIVFGNPTSTSIEVTFSAAGVNGSAPLSYAGVYRASGGADINISATLQADGLYHMVATGLTPSTGYYFASKVFNSIGGLQSSISALITTASTGSATVPTLCVITFLLQNGTGWVIDTGYNSVFGNWFLDGPNAGTIQGPTKAYVLGRIATLQASGAKVLISLGGAISPSQIATMFASGGVPFAQSLAYAFFGGTQNPLNWSNNWNGLRFDGIDLDIEANTPLPSDQRTFLQAFRASASNPASIIVTCAGVQQPNIITTNPGAVNANGPGAPYSDPTVNLTTGYNGDNGDAIINVGGMTAMKPNYIFSQIYNQGSGWYIGQSAFNQSTAMYGYMCLKAGVGTKLIIGVASDDGTPIFSNADATALGTALTAINTIIQTQTTFTTAKVSDWCAGIGFWTSPTANSVAAAAWSNGAGSVTGLPAIATMLFLSQKGNADPQWGPGTVPVPNTATSTPTPLNEAPGLPIVVGTPTSDTIVMSFDTEDVTGSAPITYSWLWGTTTTPTQVSTTYTILNDIYTTTFSGLNPSTTYYFRSVATNPAGTLQSAVTAGISTASAGSAPSKAPTVPLVSGTTPPTPTTITVTFDAAGITGIPTPTYSILYGTSTSPTTAGTATLVSGTIYTATVTGLTNATAYYFKSVATNSVGNVASAVSASISTAAAPGPPPATGSAGPIVQFKSSDNYWWVGADFSQIAGFPVVPAGSAYLFKSGNSVSALNALGAASKFQTPSGNAPPNLYWFNVTPSPPPNGTFTMYVQAGVLGGEAPPLTWTSTGPVSPLLTFN